MLRSILKYFQKIQETSISSAYLKMLETIVCDIGTDSLKVGYASERSPSCIVPSIVGRLLDDSCPKIGDDAINNRYNVDLSYPLEGGVVQNWHDTELLLAHAIRLLTNDSCDPSESKILVTEPTLNPVKNKTKMLELLMERLNFGTVNITSQPILVLYAHGLLSGMVIDCGEGATQVVPVYEGYILQQLVRRHPVTGSLITKYLSSLLQIRSNSKFAYDAITVKKIKEKMCYVSQDLEQERRLARETTVLVENYILPDGTAVKVGRERFECTEAFFDPSLIDVDYCGLSNFIYDTIQECDLSIRKSLYGHIVLSGGSSMFPGMPNRIQRDIRQRYLKEVLREDQSRSKKCHISVEAPSNREFTTFLGGCILSELMSKGSNEFWITRAMYEEIGVERLLATIGFD